MNSMMTGSANVAMMLWCGSGSPMFSPVIIGAIPLFEVKRSISTMMPNDVAQELTTSKTHMSVANAKIAMIRC